MENHYIKLKKSIEELDNLKENSVVNTNLMKRVAEEYIEKAEKLFEKNSSHPKVQKHYLHSIELKQFVRY